MQKKTHTKQRSGLDPAESERRLAALLTGEVVQKIVVHSTKELVVMFESGTRLFVDAHTDLEFSVT